MTKKLFVGSLPFALRQERLKEVFSEYGNVTEAVIIQDKFTGRSKGFGFVTFETDEEAKAAMDNLNGKEVDGRPITVTEARPMGDRPERRPNNRNREPRDNQEYTSDF
ncbi:MAG: RNA recognition motif domain-containing protein [Candidatus Woesearchaeota archaeon]